MNVCGEGGEYETVVVDLPSLFTAGHIDLDTAKIVYVPSSSKSSFSTAESSGETDSSSSFTIRLYGADRGSHSDSLGYASFTGVPPIEPRTPPSTTPSDNVMVPSSVSSSLFHSFTSLRSASSNQLTSLFQINNPFTLIHPLFITPLHPPHKPIPLLLVSLSLTFPLHILPGSSLLSFQTSLSLQKLQIYKNHQTTLFKTRSLLKP